MLIAGRLRGLSGAFHPRLGLDAPFSGLPRYRAVPRYMEYEANAVPRDHRRDLRPTCALGKILQWHSETLRDSHKQRVRDTVPRGAPQI